MNTLITMITSGCTELLDNVTCNSCTTTFNHIAKGFSKGFTWASRSTQDVITTISNITYPSFSAGEPGTPPSEVLPNLPPQPASAPPQQTEFARDAIPPMPKSAPAEVTQF